MSFPARERDGSPPAVSLGGAVYTSWPGKSKLFRVDRYRFQGMVDLFNAFNNNSVTSVNTTFGQSWLLPTGIVSPRQIRVSAQVDF